MHQISIFPHPLSLEYFEDHPLISKTKTKKTKTKKKKKKTKKKKKKKKEEGKQRS